MKAASVAGYLCLALLAFFTVGCVGDPEQPIAELTEADEETSALAASPEASSNSSAETTPAAVAEPPTSDETPSQAVQAAQQVVDQTAGVDAREVYARTIQAVRSAGEPEGCEPTQTDMLGPFYVPDAPERTSVGGG